MNQLEDIKYLQISPKNNDVEALAGVTKFISVYCQDFGISMTSVEIVQASHTALRELVGYIHCGYRFASLVALSVERFAESLDSHTDEISKLMQDIGLSGHEKKRQELKEIVLKKIPHISVLKNNARAKRYIKSSGLLNLCSIESIANYLSSEYSVSYGVLDGFHRSYGSSMNKDEAGTLLEAVALALNIPGGMNYDTDYHQMKVGEEWTATNLAASMTSFVEDYSLVFSHSDIAKLAVRNHNNSELSKPNIFLDMLLCEEVIDDNYLRDLSLMVLDELRLSGLDSAVFMSREVVERLYGGLPKVADRRNLVVWYSRVVLPEMYRQGYIDIVLALSYYLTYLHDIGSVYPFLDVILLLDDDVCPFGVIDALLSDRYGVTLGRGVGFDIESGIDEIEEGLPFS